MTRYVTSVTLIIMDMNIRNFPEGLYKKLKIMAVKEGLTLKELVIQLLGKEKS